MKKITILSLHLNFGGIEKSICSLANLLSEKYDVEIVNTYKMIDKPSFYLNEKINIKYLTNVKPNKNKIKECIKRKKIFSLIKESFKALYILYLRRHTMINYIKKCDSDIIISTRDIFNSWLGKYGKSSIKKIGWEHNHHHGNIKYANKIIKSVKNLDYLVLVSSNLKKYYASKIKNTKCVYIPNVVDDNSMQSDLKSKNFISIGRLSKEKGYIELLKIFKEILITNPDCNLNIVGDGEERVNLEKYIKENKLDNNVILHGFQNKDYINKLLLTSSVYLMTSYTESFGIVLIEAMSFGIPCIAFSSAEGACELINNNINGYLINDRDNKEYVIKANELINNYKLRKEMHQSCINKSKEYMGSKIIKKWYDILNN